MENLFRAESGDYAIVRQKIFERINAMDAVTMDKQKTQSGGRFDYSSIRERVAATAGG
jgi:hypothetical protein